MKESQFTPDYINYPEEAQPEQEILPTATAERKAHYGITKLLKEAGKFVLNTSIALGAFNAEFMQAYAQDAKHAPRKERTEHAPASGVHAKEIQEQIELAPTEQSYICKDITLSECFQVENMISGKASTAVDSEQVLEELENKGWKEAVYLHTHPLTAYEVGGIPMAKTPKNPTGLVYESMPPSGMDLANAATAQLFFKQHGIDMHMAVAGTTGVWSYEVGKGPWLKSTESYTAAQKEAIAILEEGELSDIREIGEVYQKLDNPFKFNEALVAIAEHNETARKLKEKLDVPKTKEDEQFETYIRELELRVIAIANLKANSDPLVLEAARKSFQHYCASLGIKVNFHSYHTEK